MFNIISKISLILSQFYSLNDYSELKCPPFDRYRSPDGTCNNPSAPYWGATDTSLRRIVRNYYDDGKSKPRCKDINNNDLPNVRLISNNISFDLTGDVENPLTNLHTVFGQFLDHDLSHSRHILDKDNREINCCTPGSFKANCSSHYSHAKTGGPCFPIEIPIEDPFLQRRCMNFVRSMEIPDKQKKCPSAAREQKNFLTSFVDASHIYGVSEEDGRKLRSFKGGLLKVSANGLLPENINGNCQKRNSSDYCFLAGDSRVNEHPGLSALHVVLVRYHNKIAKKLKQELANRRSNDEKLYQEAKKIVSAILQNIVYNEYLPKVVGSAATYKYKLKSTLIGEHRYLSYIDPRIINAFSTAAFRYAHSSIPNDWTYGDEKVPLVAMFHSPFFIQDFNGKGLDMIVEGMVKDSAQPADKSFSNGVRNTLFKTFKVPGLDLVAMNLQRGRDHGLAPYNVYREYCGLKRIESFNGSTEQIRTLAQVYKHPDDVDLFIGGMTEPPVNNGQVGPTFACLIGLQFHNLKYGDRFWFENLQPVSPYNQVNPAAFTIGQIEAIRQVSIARILCDTTDIKYVPRNAFLHPSARNERVSCKDFFSLPGLNTCLWG